MSQGHGDAWALCSLWNEQKWIARAFITAFQVHRSTLSGRAPQPASLTLHTLSCNPVRALPPSNRSISEVKSNHTPSFLHVVFFLLICSLFLNFMYSRLHSTEILPFCAVIFTSLFICGFYLDNILYFILYIIYSNTCIFLETVILIYLEYRCKV